MNRYRGPGLMFLAAVALVANALVLPDSLQGLIPLVLIGGLCAYATAALWWIVRAAGPAERAWPHLLAVWVPAVAPVGLLAWAIDGLRESDTAALAVAVYIWPAVISVLMCAAAALVVLFRPRKVTGRGPV